MLHDRHKFHMGKPHLLYIGRKIISHFPISQKTVRFFRHSLPRPQVYFIDGVRLGFTGFLFTLLKPFLVLPFEVGLPYQRGGLRRLFPVEGIGVSFLHFITVVLADKIFIIRALANLWDKHLPNTRTIRTGVHIVAISVPLIKVANNRYIFGIGRPNREISPLLSLE